MINFKSVLTKKVKDVFFSSGGKERCWEEVMFVYKKKNYNFYIRKCDKNDVIEIDTYNELKSIDKSYV